MRARLLVVAVAVVAVVCVCARADDAQVHLQADAAAAVPRDDLLNTLAVMAARIEHINAALESVRDDQLLYYRQLESWQSVLASLGPTRAPLPALRRWAISADFARWLLTVMTERRPRLVVEFGSGVSSLLMGYAMQKAGLEGDVITIEHDAAFVQARRREVALHGLERIVQVVHAPLQPLQIGDGLVVDYYSVAALDAIKQATREAGAAVDLLVVDGPPETQASASAGSLGRYPALPLMAEILAPNATVLVDDARRHSAMLDLWLAKLCCFDYSTDTFYSEKGAAVLYRHAERETGERVNRRVEEWFAP